MAKSSGNMYDWITHTANPLAGECIHNCSYCYVQKLKRAKPVIAEKYKGVPKLDFNGLKQISGKDKFIFVCDMTDLFADNVPVSIVNEVLSKCNSKENRYLFQTKNPERLLRFLQFTSSDKINEVTPHIPAKSVICVTIESDIYYPEIMRNSPKPEERANCMAVINGKMFDKFITIEPILEFNLEKLVRLISVIEPKQVNIGADSGNNHLPEPTKDKVLQLIKELEKFTIVKQKSNLDRLLV